MDRFIELKEKAENWCFSNGFEFCGDTRVWFAHGGTADLPDVLALFVFLLEQGGING